MLFEKTEKIIVLLLAIAFLAFAGGYARRNHISSGAELIYKDKHKEYIKVRVYGEVEKPGEYSLQRGSRICDAIYEAGGVTENAYIEKLDYEALLKDNMQVLVPKVGYVETIKVNINTADAVELCLIPGIGEKLAERIIEYRRANNGFKKAEDITNVEGIGKKSFDKIKDFIITEETQK